ncbi:MAG: DUF4340 domain-containing protein [Deltaproteobacteria bacterium]|jgi:hypothetical protein|nr:DUF4340 domain-containing protein [Deltaproteobacteria bacterium]
MTLRQVLVQAGLAAAALVAAYFVWQRGPELGPDEAIALDIAKNDLVGLRFADEEKRTWVEIGRSSDESGPFVTVRLGPQKKPTPPKPPKKAEDKDQDKDKAKEQAKDKPDDRTPPRLVRGNDSAEKLLASFAPLRANRSLGVLDAAKLKELGLDAANKRITLTLRNGKRTFAIVAAPPGGTLPYLRDEANGQVYVVARSFLSDLQAAASLLVERKPHAFRLEEADRLRITFGDVRREFVVSRGEDQVRLAPTSAPDKPETAIKTWHDKAFHLWPVEILGRGEVPVEGAPQVALRIDYSLRGRRLGFVEIAQGAAIRSSAESDKPPLYARSERTLGWVKLGSDAQNLLADAPSLLR